MDLQNPTTVGTRSRHVPRTDPVHKRGLRAVATVEASKGILGVVGAVLVLALVHKDLWDVVNGGLEFLHVNTDRHFAQVLLDLADRVTPGQLWMFASGLMGYSTLRFIEAYGLWRTRVWAEWLAILSGLVYMPFEIHEILHKSTPLRWGLLFLNLALVGYVGWIRYTGRLRQRRTRQERATESTS
jgi:uncharacterized membrane protein (DUF2068 family)